jgi:opacity protein-like surface antigen
MKKTASVLLFAALFSAPSSVHALTPYLSASTGIGLLANGQGSGILDPYEGSTTYKVGPVFALTAGFAVNPFRLEGEYSYQTNDVDQKDPRSKSVRYNRSSVLVNAYLDLPLESSSWKPYITLGLGGTWGTMKGTTYTWNKSGLSAKVGAGVGIKASNRVTVDLGYRFLTVADLFGYSLDSHQFLVGARYEL